MSKVYLAGPQVFLPDPLAEAARLKAICARHGLTGLFPLDSDLDLADLSPPLRALEIKRANCRLIRDCDAVIADMSPFRGPGMDQGTAYEIGYAEALGKPVFGYSADGSSYIDRVRLLLALVAAEEGAFRDGDGMLVEDFDLQENLMLAAGNSIAPSFEEAVREAARALGKGRG